MAAYITRAQIVNKIPAPTLNDALDDDRDGAADVGLLEAIIDEASECVDALVGARYTTPFTGTIPALVERAALAFACEIIYARRPGVEKNPFKAEADTYREQLRLVAERKVAIAGATEVTPGAAWGSSNTAPIRIGESAIGTDE